MKKLYSMRLDQRAVSRFDAMCSDVGMSRTAAVEAMMEQFSSGGLVAVTVRDGTDGMVSSVKVSKEVEVMARAKGLSRDDIEELDGAV